jgi:hypothetical protein
MKNIFNIDKIIGPVFKTSDVKFSPGAKVHPRRPNFTPGCELMLLKLATD